MRRLVVSALLTIATTATVRAAPLCECDPGWTFPASTAAEGMDAGPGGTVNVPLNVQVFVSWPGTTPGIIDFHAMNGGPVAFTGEPAGDLLGQLWLRPNGPLSPSTTYVVANGVDELTFTTGTAMDTTPPVVDHVTAQGAR